MKTPQSDQYRPKFKTETGQKKKIFLSIILVLFFLGLLALIITHNLKATFYNCFNSSDLAIYSQSLFEMSTSFNLNPWVSVRGIHTFSDHFDPILYLSSFFLHFLPQTSYSTLIIEFFWFLSFLFVLSYTVKKKTSSWMLVSAFIFFALTTKAFLVALTFPIHPATWSILPSFLLIGAIKKENPFLLFLSAFFLSLFREEYPFGLLTLGFYFLLLHPRDLKKRLSLALPLILTALGFLYFVFVIRPQILGGGYDHGTGLLKRLFAHPLDMTFQAAKDFHLTHLKFFFAAIPFLYFLLKKRENLPLFLATFFYLAPLLFIRFLTNLFQFHYSAPIWGALFGLFVFSTLPIQLLEKTKTTKFIIFLTLLLSFLSAMSSYTRMSKLVLFDKSPQCIIHDQKRLAFQDLDQILSGLDYREPFLSTGGMIPRLIAPGRNIHHLGGLSIKQKEYAYLFLERRASGNTWPILPHEIEGIYNECRQEATKILYEDKFFVLLQGPISGNCIFNREFARTF